jgi:parallel beta-helix repeat protein
MKMNPTPSGTSSVRLLRASVFGVFAAAGILGNSHASTNTYYFNSPDSTNGLTIVGQGGGGYFRSFGGSPNDPEVTGSSTNGCFVITDAVNDQRGVIIFPDFDTGLVVKAFKFSCDLRVGAGSSSPADGFSICFARADDPVLINNNGSGWAASLCSEPDLPEEGTQTGLAVCFDAWNSGCGDVIGLTIRVDNTIVTNISLPYLNLAPSNTNFAASLQTGPRNAGLAGLTWQPLLVEYTTNGLLNVAYKGVTLLTNFITPFSPTVGRLILGGRTGGYNQNQHVDNLRIETIPATTPVVGSALGNAYGFSISIFGGGAATPDTNTLTVQLDGVAIVSQGTNVSSQTAIVSNSGGVTRIVYSQSAPLVASTTHAVRVIFSGTGFSGTVDETRLFVAPTLRYVDVNSAGPMSPYTNWVTAATNIQDAVDAAAAGDEIVVTNGVYRNGGRAVYGTMTNRVAVDKVLTLRSVNGPVVTVIQGQQVPGSTNGDGAIRCVYLTSGASLHGFTLTNGATRMLGDSNKEQTGGGVWCLSASAVLSNCVLSGNSAYNNSGGAFQGTLINCLLVRNSASASGSYGGGAHGANLNGCALETNSAAYGGGADYCTLNYCTLTGNSARSFGGGADESTLNNCTLTTNRAPVGGGSYYGTLYNCTLTGNSAANNGGGAYFGTLYNCTLTGNSAQSYGGGAYQAGLANCTLSGNRATGAGGGVAVGTLYNCALTSNSAGSGGGAVGSTLTNCTLTSNLATNSGGGAAGGTLTNCTLSGNSAGSGGGAVGSTLNNCTLTSNLARNSGGGAAGGTLTNCTLSGNSAGSGGGAVIGALYNCTLSGNSAGVGGGVAGSTLINCTLTSNSATNAGGGMAEGTLYNCIVYYNAAATQPNYTSGSLNYCCTTPVPGGVGNITNAPLFVDYAGGNLRLESNSPCINAGRNAYVVGSKDLDGRPRIVDGGVDMGAYEFQPGVSGAFIGWLQHYGLPTDGSADFTDPDVDHYNNWQEWHAGSDPTNALSAPPFITAEPVSQIAVGGSDPTFSVMATPPGPGLSYQWLFNGTNDIPGATNASLTLSNVQSASAGIYSVRVTNEFGSILSSNATLQVDYAPQADGSATRTPVISVNGVNATVILDGSRSFDPEGDPLQYSWWEPGHTTALASGVVAVVVLPVGTHPITLVVSDALAVRSNTVIVAVLTTSQAVQRLISMVDQSGLDHPRPLTASLEAALASLSRGNCVAAANQLRAFQNKVSAQVAPSNPALAQTLSGGAQQVIDALQGAGAGALAAKAHGLRHQRDGKAQLRFSGLAGQIHIVEASTNLADWEMIGVAVDQGDGSFEFEDANAARIPNRFYRIVSP